MRNFEEVLMNRDNMTEEEAREEKSRAQETFLEMLSDGCGYDDIEEVMMEEYGLEMDYIDEILF